MHRAFLSCVLAFLGLAATPAAADLLPPTVALVSPANGSTVYGGIAVTADATDPDGVASVRFFLDSVLLGEDTTAPFSLPWNTAATANGSHTLTAEASDSGGYVGVSEPVTITVLNDGSPAQVGEWGPLLTWPLVAVHMTVLPTGKVLVWDAWEQFAAAKVWDPATGTFADALNQSGLFCAAHTLLADGTVLVTGGHPGGENHEDQTGADVGIVDTNRFDPWSIAWTRLADMRFPRWYPTTVRLVDGRVLTLSGKIDHDFFADTPELYDPATDTWTALVGVNTSGAHTDQYLRAHVLPDGQVYVINDADGGLWKLNVAARTWTSLGTEPRTVMASTLMYRPGQILAAAGADPDVSQSAQSTAVVIDLNDPAPAWRATGSMAYGRRNHILVPLPDGTVMAVGGADIWPVTPSNGHGVLPAERWDPGTEAWTTLAPLTDPRAYHATAALLPDGRVLTTGGGRISELIDYFSAQLYSPPYLFQGPRPTITSAPEAIAYGAQFSVDTPEAATVATVSLISLSSLTHTIDPQSRYVPLTFTAGAGTLTVDAPAGAGLAPPGYYMLFLVSPEGVPSVAHVLQVTAPAPAPLQAWAFQETGGQVVMEAEHYDTRVARGGHDWLVDVHATNYSRSAFLVAGPNLGRTRDKDIEEIAPELVFNVRFNTPGTYYVWVRGDGASGNDDSVHAGLDGQVAASADKITGFLSTGWVWSRNTMDNQPAKLTIPSSGLHTVHLWMREDGVKVDKLLLRKSSSSTPPSGHGPGESARIPLVPDETPPALTGLAVEGSTVSWITDEPATSRVEFGLSPAYGDEVSDGAFVTDHAVALPGLAPLTTYYYRAHSQDPAGNAASLDGSFTTGEAAPPAFVESGGQVVMEAEHWDENIARQDHAWELTTAKAGYAGEGYMQSLPVTGANINAGYVGTSPELVYRVQFASAGTYYIWLRASADDGTTDSAHAGIDGTGPSTADRIHNFRNWQWRRDTMDGVPASLTVPAPGYHTIHLWMREDGLRVDRILLRKSSSSTSPSGTGPSESPRQ